MEGKAPWSKGAVVAPTAVVAMFPLFHPMLSEKNCQQDTKNGSSKTVIRRKLRTIPYPRLEERLHPRQSDSSARALSKPLLLWTKKQEDELILHPPHEVFKVVLCLSHVILRTTTVLVNYAAVHGSHRTYTWIVVLCCRRKYLKSRWHERDTTTL